MPTFSLIVLSYNSGAYIDRCLEALLAQPGSAQIILADNGSTDSDFAALQARYPTLEIRPFGENLGFAAGNNRAAGQVSGDWLGFVNPDAFAAPGWLEAMTAAIAAYPDVAIFTSLQIDAGDPQRLDGAGDGMTFFGFPFRMGFGRPAPSKVAVASVFSPCGAGFVIRRDVFEKLGGFDEHFFIYCEDADLGFRARLLGHDCLLAPQARIDHIGSASTGVRSDFALYHGYRNRLWLYLKSMPLLLLLLTLPIHLALTVVGALKDTLAGRGAVVGSALRDACAGLGVVLSQRRLIQAGRKISALRLAKSLTWNPLKILRRDIDHRSPQ